MAVRGWQPCLPEALQAMQDWVEATQLPHLGPIFLQDALALCHARPLCAEWLLEARQRVAGSAWWSSPKAAVSSQGVVAYLAAKLQARDGRNR